MIVKMETLIHQHNFSNLWGTSTHFNSRFMREKIEKRFIEVLVFSIPASKFIEIETIGRLFATDIIILAIFPLILFTKHKRFKDRIVRLVIFFGVLWLCSQILTDIVRNTQSYDYYRGWAKICVSLIHFTTLYLLIYNRKRRLVLFALGLSIGGIIEYYYNPGIYAIDYPWKFGLGMPVTLLIVVVASLLYKRSFILSVSLLSFAFMLNLYMDFRSLSGVCFLSTIHLSLQWWWAKTNKYQNYISTKQLFTIGACLSISSYIFITGYGQLANQGFLGVRAQQKYKLQSSGDLGILVGGRSEILVASQAIINSPIIGYGSWAKDYLYADSLNYLLRDLGYIPSAFNDLELIPTHSHFFGAWVEAGVCGALFWGFIFILAVRFLTVFYQTKNNLNILATFIAFFLMWDILFSPFGADQRFIKPYYIIVILNFLNGKPKILTNN